MPSKAGYGITYLFPGFDDWNLRTEKKPESRGLRDFTGSYGKTSVRLVNRGPGYFTGCIASILRRRSQDARSQDISNPDIDFVEP